MNGSTSIDNQRATSEAEPGVHPQQGPVVSDVSNQIHSMEAEASQLFKGQESWINGDNLEVLKLRVGSTILSELNNIDSLLDKTKTKAGSKNSEKSAEQTEQNPETSRDAEQTMLDKIINDLMRLNVRENSMKNKVGLTSLSNFQGGYDTHRAENQVSGDSSGLIKRDPSTVAVFKGDQNGTGSALQLFNPNQQRRMGSILIDKIKKIPKPTWHAPWKLKRVVFFNIGYRRSSRLGTLLGFRCHK